MFNDCNRLSGFPGWNFTDLDSQLQDLTLLKTKKKPFKQIKPIGIQKPVCIIGGPGSFFNDHIEENLLAAVNYLYDVSC